MLKMRTAILGSAAALAMALPAGAQSYGYSNGSSYGYGQSGSYQNAYTNCEQERRQRQQTAGIVGAIAGGLLGVAIAGDDDDDRYRGRNYRGHDRYNRHGRYNRHNRYNRYNRGHRRGNDGGDQIAGAVIGAAVGGLAGAAVGGSGDDCNQRAYGDQNQAYRNQGQVRYENDRHYDNTAYNRSYSSNELYGGEQAYSYQTSSPSYGATTGATTTGYNAGYTSGYDSGECRVVYQGTRERTACNVGGDRWEFVN
jgi:uncharacterized protein YcfJ